MTSILLNNRYQVIQVLGAGGFGETFLAEDTHMPSRRRCVIKQLKPVANNPQTYQIIQQRFEREAATLEYLGENSDQIPKLYAYFLENGQFYLVQEWIQGQTLRDIVKAKGYENETIVRDILISLLSVLDYVHSKGIIHRDIKPDNIILRSRDLKPVLIDFGAVKETIRSVASSPAYATRSMVIGTPGYMPSEQAIGRPVYATDIYSLGLTAIFLLTGKNPEALPTNPHTGEIIWQQDVPHVSPDLARVLNQAIKPQVSDRFSTAKKMLYALSSYTNSTSDRTVAPASNHTATVQPTQQTQALSPPARIPQKKPQPPIWMFAGLIVGGLISGVAISSLTRQSPSTPPIANNPVPNSIPQSEAQATTPIPTNSPNINLPIPSPSPITSDSNQQPVNSAQLPQTTNQEVEENLSDTSDNTPVAVDTPTPEETSAPQPQETLAPQPETDNQTVVVTPTQTNSPPPTQPPHKQENTSKPGVPAFPTGTSRSKVEAALGKPKRDLRGLWGNTRAVVYTVAPNQIDLGYLFDRNTGVLRQTEASFAQSVGLQVMQTTLNGKLSGQATGEIQQGLQQVYQGQKDNFTFTVGRVKGQIVRNNCGSIYMSIWDADLHDFVSPSSAKQC
ncbi:serine/threonine-protein kinase [Anabaena sp. CA = ATCC 33047]|uniref:serine/threonine-protein kinase n=1 Tax=Anabaena sp. (strain CA / ATCC 33047) TaxID=52271 RepID=UPI00082A503B|nr:serine/threonine-protein kinase [Anabaena sp. CA = ATCC 33047]